MDTKIKHKECPGTKATAAFYTGHLKGSDAGIWAGFMFYDPRAQNLANAIYIKFWCLIRLFNLQDVLPLMNVPRNANICSNLLQSSWNGVKPGQLYTFDILRSRKYKLTKKLARQVLDECSFCVSSGTRGERIIRYSNIIRILEAEY